MGKYKISEEAKENLKRIYKYGVLEYGEEQADRYFEALFERFEALAESPYLYQAIDHIRCGYRRSVCGVDSIYYRVRDDEVEIMSVLGTQDINTAF
jgi:toxin ParE1/3/4